MKQIALLLALLATPALAQPMPSPSQPPPTPPPQQSQCGPRDQVFSEFARQWGEKHFWSGAVTGRNSPIKGATLFILQNKETGTWTLFVEHDGVTCKIEDGKGIKTNGMSYPTPPSPAFQRQKRSL